MIEPDELTEAEAITVRRMAEVSGVPAMRIVRHVDTALFAAAMSLATGRWDYYDSATGKWRRNKAKQERQFRNCTMTILAEEASSRREFNEARDHYQLR